KLHPGHGLFYEFHRNQSGLSDNVLLHALGQWRITKAFHDICFLPQISVPSSQLIDPDNKGGQVPIRLWHDQLFSKPPKHGGVVAWHQDYSYWTRTKPMKHLTIHIALDDQTPETGGLHFVPGSHRWSRNGNPLPITDATFGDMESLKKVLTEEEFAQFKPVPSGLKRGHASFHHPLMVHGSYANKSERPRRACVVNYIADGVWSDTNEPLLNGVPLIEKQNSITSEATKMGKIILSIAINVFLLMNTYVSGSISFTIVPETQYVYINDTVTFKCAINVTQFNPSFVTNPSDVGSELSSTGMASLTLTATSEVNGTEVTCKVSNGPTTEPAYLYVQGPPDSVSNLTGYQLDSCCMFISWYPPFTLPGLTVQYIISVGTDQQYLNDSITNYTYCPMNPTNKQYLFNITTTNKAGNGSTSNMTVGFQSTSTHDLNLTLINVTSNSVCVQFQFVNGSTLYIDYIHIIDSQGQFHWDDLKPLSDSLNFIKCFDDIPAGNNLTLYACEFDTFLKNCISNCPAVITGINITCNSTCSVVMSSVHSSSVSLTSTVLTTPSMMSVSLIISISRVVPISSVPTTSSSTSITPSMTLLPTMVPTLPVSTPSIISEFETFPSSVLTTSTTSTVQQVTSSSIISSTTYTPTISSSTSIHTTRLTSTLVTGTSTATPSSVLVPSSLTSSSITLSSLSSLFPTTLSSSLSSSFITSSSQTPSLTAPSSISSSSSIIGLASGISIALLIIIIVVIVIVVVAATVQFKKRRGRMEVTTGNIYSTRPNMIPLNGVVRDDPPPNTPPAVVPPPIYTEVHRFKDNISGSIFTIVPVTQYVYVNDNVTFECATNVTHYHLSFVTYPSVNGSDLSSGGMASLNITATREVNGTEVTCTAQQGNVITSPVYLYVQGPPDSVSSFTGYQLDSCCMFISWYPPFTLPGLTVQYIISVGTDQQYLNDSITNYTYCPMNPTNKQYLFNITTTNKAGNGSTSNITVGFQSTIDVELYVTDKERGNVNWT
uniref:Fibronectin type-III domain-containing protein n=1 Tax=Amphimedon queenslandica TaxID=400682 RepID=A0A1X7T8N7_AMPQE